MVEPRDVTWGAPLIMVVPPVQQQTGEASELEETPEPGGIGYFKSAPLTSLPLLRRGILISVEWQLQARVVKMREVL